MFRIEFFCDDKRLAAALHALLGISHGPPTVQPVVNVRKSGGGLAAKHNGNTLERLAPLLKPFKGKEISAAKEGRELAQQVGLNPSGRSYLFNKARKAGLIKKGSGKGQSTKWKVL